MRIQPASQRPIASPILPRIITLRARWGVCQKAEGAGEYCAVAPLSDRHWKPLDGHPAGPDTDAALVDRNWPGRRFSDRRICRRISGSPAAGGNELGGGKICPAASAASGTTRCRRRIWPTYEMARRPVSEIGRARGVSGDSRTVQPGIPRRFEGRWRRAGAPAWLRSRVQGHGGQSHPRRSIDQTPPSPPARKEKLAHASRRWCRPCRSSRRRAWWRGRRDAGYVRTERWRSDLLAEGGAAEIG